eukprot:GDKK01065472.1.p1 GENE.GDKK01065472.1~~GDKK01065472.1.p1  ORF type:complete len:172 (-),score=14.02 GDKK01065472.1:62-577(-)
MGERIEESKCELQHQIAVTFSKTLSDENPNEKRGGLPPRIKVFLVDVKNSANIDGTEIGQFIGFSDALLLGIREAVSMVCANGNGDGLMETYSNLVQESQALNNICSEKVAMAEGDDLTLDFVTRERLEAHRVLVMDFLRRQLPIGIRPPLNKLPPFMLRKLIPDSENFQW